MYTNFSQNKDYNFQWMKKNEALERYAYLGDELLPINEEDAEVTGCLALLPGGDGVACV